MDTNIFCQYSSRLRGEFEAHPRLAYAVLAVCAIPLLNYGITQAFYKTTQRKGPEKIPPVIPHFLPLVGNVPWEFFWNPIQFFTSGYIALIQHPVRVRLLGKDFYIIQGSEHVIAHLSQTTTSNTIFNATFLRRACGMSQKAVDRLEDPLEKTPQHFEKKYLAAAPLYAWSSSVIHRYLAGRGALKLSQRFETHLRERIQAHQALHLTDGIVFPDFANFFTFSVTAALLDSMCGKGLLEQNPGFLQAFCIFCDNLQTYMKGSPQTFAQKAYKARDEVLAGVYKWQAWASNNFNAETTPIDKDGDDPFWGSKFFRERFSTFVYDMGFEPKDIASQELGFLFGASANATANTYWCVIEVFRDSTLLKDIRKEVVRSIQQDRGEVRLDASALLQQPILQAVFSESLRLRCHNMYIRKTTEPISLVGWAIPKDQYAIAWTTPGHMDGKIWSDDNGNHPLDTFWPGRFLKYTDGNDSSQFSFSGKEGSWLPFGSGANICPGRQFAKVHCLVTLALMVDALDCDILSSPKDLKCDLSKFGMGVLPPRGKISARLRKRMR